MIKYTFVSYYVPTYVYVSVYLCVCVCTYVYLSVYLYVCVCTYLYVPMCMCVYLCVCVCTYVYVCVTMCMCVYLCVCSNVLLSCERDPLLLRIQRSRWSILFFSSLLLSFGTSKSNSIIFYFEIKMRVENDSETSLSLFFDGPRSSLPT